MKYVKKGALTTIAAAWLVLLAITTGCTVEGIPYENELAASTQMTMTVAATNNVTFALGGTGSVKIDWGDGSNPETVTVVPFDENLVVLEEDLEPYLYSHKYSSTANRTITVNGNNVTHLACFGSTGTVTHLDVSKNTALTFLLLDELNLTALDVSKNTALTYLECWGNKLTSLDVSKNIALLELFCDDNELTSIDVSKNTALTFLSLTGNPIANLDVSKNTKLKDLYVDNCLFSASGFNTLFGTLHSQTVTGGKTIYIKGNPGTASCNTKTATDGGWTVDKGSETPIAVTGVTLNKSVLSLTVSQNETLIATVAPSNATNKAVTWSSTNNLIATVDATGKVTAVKEGTATIIATTADGEKKANCTVTVSSATATATPQMTFTTVKTGEVEIVLAGTGQATIDWGDGTQKETYTLNPFDPFGPEVDVNIYSYSHLYSGASARTVTIEGDEVTFFGVQEQQVTSIDVTKNAALKYMDCGFNQLTSIDVSKNIELLALRCEDNELAGIDVSKNTELVALSLTGNSATNLDVSQHTKLKNLYVDNCQFSAAGLNALFGTLHSQTITGGKTIYIGGNPGTASCNKTTATSKGWTVSETPIAVTGVTLNKSTLSLTVAQNETLIATVAPSNATNKAVTWSSTNNLIATVDATGKVTAVKAGTATITATTADGGKKANCTVTVNAATVVPVTGVTLETDAWTISEDSETTLIATVSPANATNKAVTWSSSNPGTATVDASGNVTGILPGTANITATTADGGYTATCEITVISNEKEMYITTNGAGEKTLELHGTGIAVIYWNDGMMTNLSIRNSPATINHTYTDNGAYNILVHSENITGLNCDGQNISYLDVSKNTDLKTLLCGSNVLISLDVSKNTALTELHCEDNKLKSLNLINNTALISLNCSNNELTAEALDNLFHSLHNNTYSQKKIMITGNPGAASCNTQIATDKGWTFVTEL